MFLVMGDLLCILHCKVNVYKSRYYRVLSRKFILREKSTRKITGHFLISNLQNIWEGKLPPPQ